VAAPDSGVVDATVAPVDAPPEAAPTGRDAGEGGARGTVPDAAADLPDTGTNVLDAGTNILDAGTNVLDAGTNVLDAGSAVFDAGIDVNGTMSPDPGLLGFSIVGFKPLMRPRETRQFQLWGYYSDGQTHSLPGVLWSSGNPAVLSLPSSGFSEALAEGTSIVSAALDGKVVATVLITVRNVTLVSVSIGPPNPTVPFPDALSVTATGVYSDGSMFDLTQTRTVEWESDRDLVFDASALSGVTVSAIGRVGTFRISATFEGVTASAAVTVPFGTPSSITLQEPPELPVGVTYPVVALALYGYLNLDVTSLVTWSVDDPTIMTVGANGVVVPLKPGTTLVHASYPGFDIAPLPITVSPAVLKTVELVPSDFTMHVGDLPQPVQAYGTYDNGQMFEVTARAVWATANPRIAMVSDAGTTLGLVTPVMAGTTVLQATVGGVTGSTTVSVERRAF